MEALEKRNLEKEKEPFFSSLQTTLPGVSLNQTKKTTKKQQTKQTKSI